MDNKTKNLVELVETILDKLKDRFTAAEYDFVKSSLSEIINEES